MSQTFNSKTTIYMPMVIRCCKYRPQSVGNRVLSHKMLKVVAPGVHTQLDPGFQIIWRPGCLRRPLAHQLPRFNSAICFFMWGSLQGKVCTNKLRSISDLKGSIHQEIATITPDVLQPVFISLKHGVKLCMDARGYLIRHCM
jgi:hypothetical protein